MGYADIVARPAAAHQQPEWEDAAQALRVRKILAGRPPLVGLADVRALRARLAVVAAGDAVVMQAGDCSEDPADCTPAQVRRKVAMIHACAEAFGGGEVVRIGRIAGQFAKPRSRPVEQIDGVVLPVYRGHMVNGPLADPRSRFADPRRMLTGYLAASRTMTMLGWSDRAGPTDFADRDRTRPVWTSHEALLLDYELPMLRRGSNGTRWLASTHFPWIGDRTRQRDGAHVALLAGVANPVGCKVGPTTTADGLATLCRRLDPDREPGRLTLIARMGADRVAELLPPLVRRVRAEGHPVVWLCDPMHGNTVTAPAGVKTRLVTTMVREVRGFRCVVTASGGVAGGLHLETTPDDTTECVLDESELDHVADRYTTLCDPRLNPDQSAAVIGAW